MNPCPLGKGGNFPFSAFILLPPEAVITDRDVTSFQRTSAIESH
ncbi:hypothetical protein SNOG_06875 [Parastagonospora nodorum SN15]|uniref:Uncharacterized protein n=1 Tax=Phaeosphaeria nodorum (strain SN15 / ATCC MYA-4574 / FGSC 10173) TaxID=321614 RepID=Q0UMY9_PHANO|nr:hypothetical protein SNOG_06875 [Parastagonospora nodorum SN15]EAT85526.1 hypothetical protein SNOG_06875 [Parastagonospora nodorum SN15]